MTQDIRTALAGLLAAHIAICRDAGIDPTINAQYREARALLATPAPLSDEPVLRCNDCGGFDIEQVPETMKPESIADTADYKRMFEEAVSALAAIDNALGIDPDEAGGAAPILEAIERLRNDGECRSCVDDKCVTGPECVTLGRDAAPTPERAQPISDAMMDLVDRLGSEASEVDPRAWKHLLVYAPERADADTAGAKPVGSEWRALFNSTRSPETTFEQFCEWMREELAATPASSVVDAAGASDAPARKKLCRGSHIMCEGREYCLGEPSCKDLAEKESGND